MPSRPKEPRPRRGRFVAEGRELAAELAAASDERAGRGAGPAAGARGRAGRAGAAPRPVAMAAESDYEVYRYALWRGRVTFHDVAGAWFYMSDPELTEPQREPFKQLFPGMLDAFAEPRHHHRLLLPPPARRRGADRHRPRGARIRGVPTAVR